MASSGNQELELEDPIPPGSGLRASASSRSIAVFGAFRSEGAARWLFIWPTVLLVLFLSLFPLIASLALSVSRLSFNQGGVVLRLAWPPALVGSLFLATHPAAFTAVWWISAHGDIAASLLAVASLAAWRRGERARWAAPPLFLSALLFKESVLLVPVVAAAVARLAPAPCTPRAFQRDPAWLAMLGLMLAWPVLASPAARLGGEAYALSAGALVPNLLTYAGWTLDAWGLTVRNVSDAVAPWEFGWGAAWLALLVLACALPALRRRGAAVAALGWLAMLAPVLPAAHHTYHYYLVAALP